MPTEPSHSRGPVVKARVLDATLRLIAERGYAFSVEEVATMAGVHKTTIYRSWPTKSGLVAAAVDRLADIEVPVARTGDPVADLVALAMQVARSLHNKAGRQALRAVATAAGDDEDVVPTARRFLTGRYELAESLVRDAKSAGLIRPNVNATLLWESIVNPLHMRAILGAPADANTAHDLAMQVLEGTLVAARDDDRDEQTRRIKRKTTG